MKVLTTETLQLIQCFEKTTGVTAEHCFSYNNHFVFVVKPEFMPLVLVGRGGKLKKLSSLLRKKVKVIASPRDNTEQELKKFVAELVYPVKFRNVEVKNGEVVIYAGPQARALLIGRNRKRQEEMESILRQYFQIKELRILHG